LSDFILYAFLTSFSEAAVSKPSKAYGSSPASSSESRGGMLAMSPIPKILRSDGKERPKYLATRTQGMTCHGTTDIFIILLDSFV